MSARHWLVMALLFCVVAWVAPALVGQSAGAGPRAELGPQANEPHPDFGAIEGKRYVNGYFGFSYRYPDGWNASVGQASSSSTSYMYILFTASPAAPQGSDMRYMCINVDRVKKEDTPKTVGDGMVKTVASTGIFDVQQTEKRYTFGGKQFYRLDAVSKPVPGSPTLYQSLVFTLLPNYAVTFSFMSTNRNDLEEMIRSLASLDFTTATPGRTMTLANQPQAK